MEQWKNYNKHLVNYNRPEEHQRETLNNLIELRILNEGLEKQVKKLKVDFRDRADKYDEMYRAKTLKKVEIEALKIKLNEEAALRVQEGDQYEEKIAEEKERFKKEKEKRNKLKEEKTLLDSQYKCNYRQLGELQVEMIELKRNHEQQVLTWEKERGHCR